MRKKCINMFSPYSTVIRLQRFLAPSTTMEAFNFLDRASSSSAPNLAVVDPSTATTSSSSSSSSSSPTPPPSPVTSSSGSNTRSLASTPTFEHDVNSVLSGLNQSQLFTRSHLGTARQMAFGVDVWRDLFAKRQQQPCDTDQRRCWCKRLFFNRRVWTSRLQSLARDIENCRLSLETHFSVGGRLEMEVRDFEALVEAYQRASAAILEWQGSHSHHEDLHSLSQMCQPCVDRAYRRRDHNWMLFTGDPSASDLAWPFLHRQEFYSSALFQCIARGTKSAVGFSKKHSSSDFRSFTINFSFRRLHQVGQTTSFL